MSAQPVPEVYAPNAASPDHEAYVQRFELEPNWTAEIYREWVFPQDVMSWWQAASEQQGDIGLFTSPGWLEQCWIGWGTPGTLFVVVLRERGRMRGIIPCQTGNTDFGYSGICSLPVNLTHYDIVTDGNPDSVVSAFVRLIERHFPAAHLQFDCLAERSASLIERSFRARNFGTWGHSEALSHYVVVDGSWEQFLSSLSSHMLKELRRRRRQAQQAGAVAWEMHTGLDGLPHILNEALSINARSWKGRAGTAITQRPPLERFLRHACAWAARENKLRFFCLRINGKMAAFQINIVNGGTMFGSEMSFDEDAAQYSPGQLAVFEMLERLFHDPAFHKYSFLGPRSPWKERWTRQAENYHWMTIYPRTLAGRTQYFWRHRWKEPFKRSQAVTRIRECLGIGATNVIRPEGPGPGGRHS
jgi:hypothetical protein